MSGSASSSTVTSERPAFVADVLRSTPKYTA
jgi:hypothetical protein